MSTMQMKFDTWIETAIVRYIPTYIKPNHLTVLRIILVPGVLYCIASQWFGWGLAGFIFAALLDAVDGTLARRRNLISPMGQFLDPIADKSLIFFTLLFLSYVYAFPVLILFAAILELTTITLSAVILFISKSRKTVPANWLGKTKMIAQVVSVVGILVALVFNLYWLSLVAAVSLLISIIFELLSFVSYQTKILFHK